MESRRELRRDHHTHIIAVGTLLSPFRRMLDSLDPREEIPDIIGSLDIRYPLNFTDLHECLIALIILRSWLDIRIVPETDHFIFIAKCEDRHRDIWPTTNMDEDTRFGFSLRHS